MFKISKLTDYAMLVMSLLAKDAALVLSAKAIASTLHLPQPTVSKILKILAESNLVESIRGAEGGYHLARSPSKISIADIIAAMEGEWALTECCTDKKLCTLESVCALKGNWRKLNHLVFSMLNRVSISDMLTPLSQEGFLYGK